MKRLWALLTLALVVTAAAGLPVGARNHMVVVRARGTQAPRFVSGIAVPPMQGSPAFVAHNYLATHGRLFGMDRSGADLRVLDVHRARGTTTVRFGQRVGGHPVWGAQYLVHLDREGEGFAPTTVNGHYFSELIPPSAPRLNVHQALALAKARSRGVDVHEVYRHGLTVLPVNTGRLTYHFSLRGSFLGTPVLHEVFVDAHTGAVAMAYDNLQREGPVVVPGRTSHGDDVNLGAYDRGGVYELRDQSKPMFAARGGEIVTHDAEGSSDYLAKPQTLVTSDQPLFNGADTRSGAVDAHFGASFTYDFFQGFGRDSLDGQGGSIVSTVNATEAGEPMYNAFWDGINKQMVYGNPDPQQYHPFSAALDVVGHELTHGVTQHTGNLAYINQSGAMNEAYSDYFGNAIEVTFEGTSMSDDEAGYVGEGLCKVSNPDFFPCPLRDLNDEQTTEDFIYYLTDLDNGGVHLNSTIYAGALWDVREELEGDADRYIFHALESFTTPLDDFVDGRNSVVAAAQDLAAPPEHIEAIEDAFSGKGIESGWDATSATDATVVLKNVAPVSDIGFSSPEVSNGRFVITDYEDKEQICCVGLQVFSGPVDGSAPVEAVTQGPPSSTRTDEAPDISGDTVVWSRVLIEGARALDAHIVARDFGGAEKIVATSDALLMNPAIDGSLVAWESIGGNANVKARYLGRRVQSLGGGPGDQIMPAVSGNWVAWWDLRRIPKIVARNMKTGARRVVTPSDDFTLMGPPGLGGRFVYWWQDSDFDGIGSIVRMDLKSKKRRTVVPQSSDFAPVWGLSITFPPVPSANDRFLVYTSEIAYLIEFAFDPDLIPNDQVGRDVFIVPISGGQVRPVTDNRADQAHPVIADGRRVLWLDSSQATTDLMTREVP